MTARTRLIPLFVVAGMCWGCAPKSIGNQFRDDVRAYNEGVRWRIPGKAALHVPVREREEFLEERAQLDEDLRIGDYEVTRVRWGKNKERARVEVRYTWHLDSRGIVHKTTTRQLWRRYGKRWMMVEEQLLRGEPMPGVMDRREERQPAETIDRDPIIELDQEGEDRSASASVR